MAFTSTVFPHELISTVFTGAKGHSSIAKLSDQDPIPFTGTDIMTFNFEGEINLVGENEKKGEHTNSNDSVKIRPVKIEYGVRVSDEFMRCSEERRLEILKGFTEGFSKKIARGVDIMAFHGTNPATGNLAPTLIGDNSLDTNSDVSSVTYDATDLEGNLDSAVFAIGDYENTGMAFSKTFAAGLSKIKEDGISQYPQFKLGANPGDMNGISCDVNSTVSAVAGEYAYVGDFKNAFKWGYADIINFDVIEYGDPDNSGKDLKGYNQVYLRAEAFVGWGILDGAAFARIETTGSGS